MFTSKVKAKLARDEPVLVFTTHLTDRAVQEMRASGVRVLNSRELLE